MWGYGVSLLFEAKDLTGFVYGTEKEPTIDDGIKTAPSKVANDGAAEKCITWKKKSSQAEVILLGSTDRSVHAHLVNCHTPKVI